MLGSAESEKVRIIAGKLFSKNSNLYDHDTTTLQLQTDGQTDNLSWQYRDTRSFAR